MQKKDFSEILLEQGTITKEQLHDCTQQILETGQTIAACLIERFSIPSVAIAQAFATSMSLEFVDKISEKMADPVLLARIPLKFLRQNVIMPITKDGSYILLTADPLHFAPLDELNMLLGGQTTIAVATPETIIDGINRYYPLEGAKAMMEELEEEDRAPEAIEFEEIEEKDILAMAAEAPIIKLVNHILVQAAKQGASDIHIEPYEKEVRVRYRIDGVMYPILNPPKRLQSALVSRIKIMANLNIAEKRIPQDGRIAIKVADKAYDIRVSVLPTQFGERIVMRLLDKSRTFVDLKNMGMSARDFEVLKQSIQRPNGIIYVSGPTGSGKTTTLYSVLNELNSPDVNIITVEDPVEYQLAGIAQVQVKEKIGLTFAAALRSILRQDPDIVMIGETRDQETAQISIQAALTGHLVLSTIHTNNAPATITRLIDMGIEPFLIASSVVCVVAQRLVRRLCNKCKQAYKPSADLLKSIGLTEQQAASITFYKAVGCEDCVSGYKGRLAVYEVMAMTGGIAKLAVEQADTMLLRKQAIADGMTLLIDDGIRRIKEGITTIEEVVRVAAAEEELL